jgi:DNA repair protein RadC
MQTDFGFDVPVTSPREHLPRLYRLETYRVSFVCEPGMVPGQPVRSSEDLASYARSIYATLDADKEHFTIIAANNKNRVNGFKVVSTGSLTASLVHPREVWRAALHLCAAAVLFVHNHPSGDPAPSPEDIDITKRLKETADILGIRVLDHVILGHDRYFSFTDKGML